MPERKRQTKHPHASRVARAAPSRQLPARGGMRLWPKLALAAGVGLVVLAVYWPVLSSTALYLDDKEYVLENALVQRPGWESARRFFGEVLAPSTVRGYYQPLTMVSLMLDAAGHVGPASGRSESEWLRPFHRTSLALHVLNAASLVLLLAMLLQRVWPAAAAGLLWGLHPLTVEPVPWIAERKTLLATFFVLWALILYVHYARRTGSAEERHARWRSRHAFGWLAYAGVLLCCVLALLSKPSALPLPLLLLILDYWPLRRLDRRAVFEKLPLLAIAGVAAGLAFLSQARTAEVGLPWHQEAGRAIFVVCHNIVFYIEKVLWPARLFPLYLAPEPFNLSQPGVRVGIAGTIALAAAMVFALRRTRAVTACLGFFIVAVFPTLGVIAVHGAIAADRHMYLPLIGFALLAGWGLNRLPALATLPDRRAWLRPALVALVLVACTAEALATRTYLGYWRDNETLHRRVMAMAPQAVEPHWELADLLRREGRLADALKEYRTAIELAPNLPVLRHNFGSALAEQGDAAGAIAQYEKALELDNGLVLTHNLLGLALADQGRFAEALPHFETALQRRPGLAFTLNNYGVVLEKAGRLNDAIVQYRAAVQAQPDFALAHSNLGQALGQLGQIDEALRELRIAVQCAPGDARLHYLLGLQLEKQNLNDQAAAEYRAVLQIEPGHTEARARLAALGR
jgi:tetratricopeptide (TPR) repeat protein